MHLFHVICTRVLGHITENSACSSTNFGQLFFGPSQMEKSKLVPFKLLQPSTRYIPNVVQVWITIHRLDHKIQ